MKKSVRTSLLLAVGLVAGVAVAMQSFGIVNQRRSPERTLAMDMVPQGVAKASLSRALQGARLAKDPKSVPTEVEIRLAREAFAEDPLAVAALPVLVQGLAADGKAGTSQLLLDLTAKLTRRDNLVNAMLIDGAMQKDDMEGAVKLLGRAMAVSYQVREVYVLRMAAATANPGAFEALPPILGRDPPWASEYWNAVLNVGEIIPSAGALRLRTAAEPWNLNKPRDTDFRLIRELAVRGHPELAFANARALGMQAPQGGELFSNPDFDRIPVFAPIDWELLQTGEIGATIDPAEKALLLSSLPAASGVAARQLVRIREAGRYRVQWEISGLAQGSDATLKMRLTCAESSKGGRAIAPAMLTGGKGSAVIDVPASACEWYWAGIELDTALGDVGVDVAIHRLSLRRDGGAAAPARPQS